MQQKQYQLSNIDIDILAIYPIETDTNSLYILTENGRLYRYDILQQQLFTVLNAITLPILNHRELRHYGTPCYNMKCSANGKFVAIYVDYGQFGIVIDTEKKRTVLKIDTQNYYEDTVPFSLAFTILEDDDIVIYRSLWNRLECFNLSKNISPTERYIAPYEQENRPEHCLDYFHGALHVSPNAESIFDDGWVWSPVAMPCVWSLTHWLKHNPFESEDGKSLQRLCIRDYWGAPVCWLDDQHIAIWLIQIWDEDEFEVKPIPENQAGIHILSMHNTMWDQDYVARYWEMPQQTQEIFNMYVDDAKLLLVGNENISCYDIKTRQLIQQIPNTLPNKHHINRRSLWAWQRNTLIETDLTHTD